MTHKNSLSLMAATLININIMLGTGTFVNTVLLAHYAGIYGGLLYCVAGIIMLPLILSIAQLTSQHQEGTFYTFGSLINPYWGFLSSWSYFVGKLGSAALSIHVFSRFIQHTFPALQTVETLYLDSLLIILFVILNTLNVKTGSRIQYFFIVTKGTPLLFALFAGLYGFNIINHVSPTTLLADIPLALPLVLFCCLGFEAACSLSPHIENSEKNAPKAIIYSFSIVILLSCLYQTVFYGALGSALSTQASYINAFPLLLKNITPSFLRLAPLFSIAIATSALGGAYGILYSNIWNLYTLAKHKHIFGASYFTLLNNHNIPTLCVIAEGIICISYLFLTHGSQVPLQYTATLGCITAYSVSIMGLFKEQRSLLSISGLISCFILLSVCVLGFIKTSIAPFIIFTALLSLGIIMFKLSLQKA